MKTLAAVVIEMDEFVFGIRTQLRNRPFRKSLESHFTRNAVYPIEPITNQPLLKNTENQAWSILKRFFS